MAAHPTEVLGRIAHEADILESSGKTLPEATHAPPICIPRPDLELSHTPLVQEGTSGGERHAAQDVPPSDRTLAEGIGGATHVLSKDGTLDRQYPLSREYPSVGLCAGAQPLALGWPSGEARGSRPRAADFSDVYHEEMPLTAKPSAG